MEARGFVLIPEGLLFLYMLIRVCETKACRAPRLCTASGTRMGPLMKDLFWLRVAPAFSIRPVKPSSETGPRSAGGCVFYFFRYGGQLLPILLRTDLRAPFGPQMV